MKRVKTMNIKEVAKEFGYSEKTIRRWANAGRLTDIGPGRRKEFAREEVMNLRK